MKNYLKLIKSPESAITLSGCKIEWNFKLKFSRTPAFKFYHSSAHVPIHMYASMHDYDLGTNRSPLTHKDLGDRKWHYF